MLHEGEMTRNKKIGILVVTLAWLPVMIFATICFGILGFLIYTSIATLAH
jgi:hypothetical protein